jgi:hypothetical protein
VTEERLFLRRKVCYRDFERDGTGSSKRGHCGESSGCVKGDGVMDAGGGDAKGN